MKTGRIVRSTDFERVLRVPPRAKSPHFALHHLRGTPSRFVRKRAAVSPDHTAAVPVAVELSTGDAPEQVGPVDDSAASAHSAPVPTASPSLDAWLGTVVPKRHARRSVTRSLVKRQMHAAFDRETGLPGGLWVVRLRAAFDVKQFPSAASDVLRQALRQELDALLAGLKRRLQAEVGA